MYGECVQQQYSCAFIFFSCILSRIRISPGWPKMYNSIKDVEWFGPIARNNVQYNLDAIFAFQIVREYSSKYICWKSSYCDYSFNLFFVRVVHIRLFQIHSYFESIVIVQQKKYWNIEKVVLNIIQHIYIE